MPAVVPLIVAGVSAAASAAAAKKQADAIKSGAAIQGNSTQQALDFTKQQYADVTGRLSPFVASGQTADNYATALLGNSPYLKALRPAAPAAAPAPASAPTSAPAGASVTLKAPDGSTRQFTAGDPMIAKAQAAGAQVVA